ncbi:hypothetical protein SB49_12460 [Sediminicola sp. YIK13]|uniref:hypothetical protein n=1 Tax=Sediminicola sp. YIK13 TaxID=1453352 RepID=UPI00071EC85F|nr:hypothetical protein [Sediminicola sp. YIK13]ALM08528.1 hypothetical protein SB49_12460 [Sediminicola sp. YIK13]
MIKKVRETFNENYKQEYYDNLKNDLAKSFGEPCAFRISETPFFIDKELKKEVFDACDTIIEQLWKIDFEEIREKFIPKKLQSPSVLGKPHFLAIDFGLCDDGQGGIAPKLIELQSFPSLFLYQALLGESFLKNYPQIPKEGFHFYLNDLNEASYLEELKRVIVGDENPENVILLEIYPEKQKTRIDFWATKQALGIEVLCLTKVIKEGKNLFYEKNGRKVKINRIYNRVILDELLQMPDLKTDFNLTDDVDVEWVTHPDWFFMISKCIMPLLSHKNIPQSFYLNDFPKNLDLSAYVLKPLFSFAGKGINLNPTLEFIEGIKDRHNYILQSKVKYSPIVKAPSGTNSKVELRILYTWSDTENRLMPVINLTRMNKGDLINVSYLSNDDWVGSSISFFED